MHDIGHPAQSGEVSKVTQSCSQAGEALALKEILVIETDFAVFASSHFTPV